MQYPIRGFLLGFISTLVITSTLPMQVEGAAAFFFRAPPNYLYNRTYYQPYYRQPINPYYAQPYSPYADPRVYADPRSNARGLNNQGGDASQDYYQQYDNWWQR